MSTENANALRERRRITNHYMAIKNPEPKHLKELLDELTKEVTKTNVREKLKEAFLYGQKKAADEYRPLIDKKK